MTFSAFYKKITVAAMMFAVAATSATAKVSEEWNADTIKGHMKKMAQWQLDNPRHLRKDGNRNGEWTWVYGAFFTGMSVYGNMEPEGTGLEAIRTLGKEKDWALGPRLMHADDICTGQGYMEVAIYDRNEAPIKIIEDRLNKIMDQCDPEQVLEFGRQAQTRWCWSDALFMAPPLFVKMYGYTGDEKYLNFLDREYKASHDYLYDKKANLFFRDSRYFEQKASNGNNVFWGRGNSWVFGGLPHVLRDMPYNWKNRSFYEGLFKEMAVSLKKAQAKDGSWHPSLLDEKEFNIRDMSATMFITYGMMWGINNGLLPEKEYLPVVKKAWSAACDSINEEGALGWVQPIADKPGQYTEKATEAYGTGAFLLAASEIYKYIIKNQHPQLKAIIVQNNLQGFRKQETITIPTTLASGINPKDLRIFDERNGRVIPHQPVDTTGNGTVDSIIFQADFYAGTAREFWIMGSKTLPAATTENVCYSRYVPERMDDFAWENDLSAYRCYGPVLMEARPKGEGLVSSGIDIWCKRVRTPIIDQFYKSKAYHIDHGQGMDFYKVGTGRGCGGTTFFVGDKPYVSKNWSKATNICNGPIRTVFELEYEQWDAGSKTKVAEKRRVSFDAGSWFTRSESQLTIKNPSGDATFGPGLDIDAKHENNGPINADEQNGIITVWGQGEKQNQNGTIGTALISTDKVKIKQDDKTISIVVPATNKPIVWYTGSTWTRAGYIKSEEEWKKAAENYSARLKSPLELSLKKK